MEELMYKRAEIVADGLVVDGQPFNGKLKVSLNGNEVYNCVEADVELGFVRLYQLVMVQGGSISILDFVRREGDVRITSEVKS